MERRGEEIKKKKGKRIRKRERRVKEKRRGRREEEETQKSFTLVSLLNGVAPSQECRMARIFHVGYGLFQMPLDKHCNHMATIFSQAEQGDCSRGPTARTQAGGWQGAGRGLWDPYPQHHPWGCGQAGAGQRCSSSADRSLSTNPNSPAKVPELFFHAKFKYLIKKSV